MALSDAKRRLVYFLVLGAVPSFIDLNYTWTFIFYGLAGVALLSAMWAALVPSSSKRDSMKEGVVTYSGKRAGEGAESALKKAIGWGQSRKSGKNYLDDIQLISRYDDGIPKQQSFVEKITGSSSSGIPKTDTAIKENIWSEISRTKGKDGNTIIDMGMFLRRFKKKPKTPSKKKKKTTKTKPNSKSKKGVKKNVKKTK